MRIGLIGSSALGGNSSAPYGKRLSFQLTHLPAKLVSATVILQALFFSTPKSSSVKSDFTETEHQWNAVSLNATECLTATPSSSLLSSCLFYLLSYC